ncbi:MAG TPA: hypothetical protein DCM58_03330 [Desulfovibrio sp.]|nr:hypothetical protein [Desulfovibrio sp.]
MQRGARQYFPLWQKASGIQGWQSLAEGHHQHRIKKFRNRRPRFEQDTKKPVPSGRHRKRCLEFFSRTSIKLSKTGASKAFQRYNDIKDPAWSRHPYS